MFLPADVQAALQATRGARQCAGRIATLVGVAVEYEVLFAQGIDHVDHRFQIFILNDRGHGRFTRGFQAVGCDGNHRLADIFDLAVGQQRITGHDRADVELARYVLRRDGDGHARNLVAGRGVDAHDAGMGAVAHAGIDVQLIGEFQTVVDIHRLASDMLGRAVVLDAAADAGDQVLFEQGGDFFLGFSWLMHMRSPLSRLPGFVARGSICAASSVRPAGGIRGWHGSRSVA